MALRLLQDHLRNVEKRIRPPGHFDLPRQRFDPFFVRHQVNFKLRQRLGLGAAIAFFAAPKCRPITTGGSATTFRARRRATLSAWPVLWSASAGPVASWRSRTASVLAAIHSLMTTF